ncbi:MAG: hypothetical protein FJX53_06425 [Alphaproteobacteria bacterium]|nr:hypothetical protein [Alphaproteobacteria bacterium]
MIDARLRLCLAAASVAAGVTLSILPAVAQQAVKITYISGYPPAATFAGAFVDTYVKEVDASLAKTGKFKADWVLAHSGQVAKARGELEALQSGIGDISTVPTPFHLDKVPLFNIVYVTPFTTDNPDFLSSTLAAMEGTFPDYEKLWAALNQRSLIVSSNVDNYVIASSKPLAKFADLKGIKVGAAGANLPWVTAAGAAGVSSTLADFYNGLSTGIFNAALAWPQALGSFKLCEPAPYMLDAGLGSSSMINLNVNLDSWKKWPEEVRNALAGAAPAWHKAQIALLVNGAQTGIDKCKADYKMTVTKLSPEDVKAWAYALPPLAIQWADSIEAKGLPAKKVLAAYMDKMRAGKQRVVRNWDKE